MNLCTLGSSILLGVAATVATGRGIDSWQWWLVIVAATAHACAAVYSYRGCRMP